MPKYLIKRPSPTTATDGDASEQPAPLRVELNGQSAELLCLRLDRLCDKLDALSETVLDVSSNLGNLTADDTLDRFAIALAGKSPYAALSQKDRTDEPVNLTREAHETLLSVARDTIGVNPPGTPADRLDITDAGAAALEAAADTGVLDESQEASPAIALAMLAPDKEVQNASVFDTVGQWAEQELRGRLGRASAGQTWDALSKLPTDSATKALTATADLVKLGIAAAMDRHARKRLTKEMEFPLSTLANLLALEVAVIRRVLADVLQLAFGIAAKLATQHLRPVL